MKRYWGRIWARKARKLLDISLSLGCGRMGPWGSPSRSGGPVLVAVGIVLLLCVAANLNRTSYRLPLD